MKRLQLLFAFLILLFALPFWRFIDMVAILSPLEWLFSLALLLWFGIFVAIPVRLIFPKVKTYYLILGFLCFGSLAWWSNPLSKMATTDPSFNHCGKMTYTGFMYPLHEILSEAHRDDLEIRNQLCWIRKMISKVPQRFDSKTEIEDYSKIIQSKLLRPEIKYRASLPMIAVLYFTINTSAIDLVGVKLIYDSLHFWINHYTEEIGQRQYSIWNWPHSSYIQFEYGLIENNWQSLIDSIVVQE